MVIISPETTTDQDTSNSKREEYIPDFKPLRNNYEFLDVNPNDPTPFTDQIIRLAKTDNPDRKLLEGIHSKINSEASDAFRNIYVTAEVRNGDQPYKKHLVTKLAESTTFDGIELPEDIQQEEIDGKQMIKVAHDINGKLFVLRVTEDTTEAIPLDEIKGINKKVNPKGKFDYRIRSEGEIKDRVITLINHPDYKKAVNKATAASSKYLPEVLSALGYDTSKFTPETLQMIYDDANLYDSIEVAGNIIQRLGLNTGNLDVYSYSPEYMRKILSDRKLFPGAFWEKEIPENYLRLTKEKTKTELLEERKEKLEKWGISEDDYSKILEIKARMNQVSWYAGQDERAWYETSVERISTKANYLSYDDMITTIFGESLIRCMKYIPKFSREIIKDLEEDVNYRRTSRVIDTLNHLLNQTEQNNLQNNSGVKKRSRNSLYKNVGTAVYNALIRVGFEVHKDVEQKFNLPAAS